MAPTSDERREVAARLRKAAVDDGHVGRPYGGQGFQVTLRRIIGTSNPKRPTLYARLADLMDPTCEIVSFEGIRLPRCSRCGQPILKPWPNFCPNCGARVTRGGER
jgi:hypothetical protein